jgi:NAD(P)H-dependent flavin oxidoreductase YrpB (nitropropane dioxygenase family)
MSHAAFAPLAAAVCNAGGLGILGAQAMRAEEVKEAIKQMRDLTDKPFGVNFLPYHPDAEKILDIMIEEKVAVASYGRGNPQRIIERTKPVGIFNLPTMGAVRHAMRAEKDGADAIIIQGTEAGGHCSYVATTVLLPKTVDSVKIPVVAAGGFCDGRGLVAALAFGAEGIAMGSRFIVTKESTVPDNIKQHFIKASENDTLVTDKVTGTRCRGLENKLTELLETKGEGFSFFKALPAARAMSKEWGVPTWKILRSGMQMKEVYEIEFSKLGYASFGGNRIRDALVKGDETMGFMPCGQVCGRINDIPTVKELIESIVAEAEEILDKITPKIKAPATVSK